MTFMNTLRDWRTTRRTRTELARLPDRILIDAGIPRWRIDDVAHGAPVDPRQVV